MFKPITARQAKLRGLGAPKLKPKTSTISPRGMVTKGFTNSVGKKGKDGNFRGGGGSGSFGKGVRRDQKGRFA